MRGAADQRRATYMGGTQCSFELTFITFPLVPLLTIASCKKILFTSASCSFYILFSTRISHYLNFSASLTQALQENKCYFLKFWLLQSRGSRLNTLLQVFQVSAVSCLQTPHTALFFFFLRKCIHQKIPKTEITQLCDIWRLLTA